MSIYTELGVRPIINAIGTFTRLGGSLMPPEVVQAMQEAAGQFVCMEELQHAAGQAIAQMTGAEAAYVTSGAQAALVLSIAACLTGLDAAKMDQLPNSVGMKNEVIMARFHRNHYDHAVEAAGGRIIEVGQDDACTLADIAAAINEQTAAILHLPWRESKLALGDVVQLARRHGVLVVVDAAGRCDEPGNLTAFVASGADLVCFSGGKFIRGPQASGFVCGRRALISAIAWQHLDMDITPQVWTAPRELLDPAALDFVPRQGIGRGYKAGKEEIVGLVTALRLYFQRDHAAEKAACWAKLQTLCEELDATPHVTAELITPSAGRGGFPLARIRIDEQALGLSGYDFIWALKSGEPSIHPGERELAQGAVIIHPFGLQVGEELAIARRVQEIVRGRM
ncbi:MAG: aminotransferase class V-fold PLP-dependent enzyme [Caldilineaceae bacterium]|nr:aminotransferase class V-fold PLP-dependent enzyme [Caldilineaceae bacterium]